MNSSSSTPRRQQACKQYQYVSSQQNITVKVLELLDADFGLYVWPSALVMAEYIFHHLEKFTGSIDNPKVILELGAGTGLPSLLLAKATAPGSNVIITTDRPHAPFILDNIRKAYKKNHIEFSLDPQSHIQNHRIMVRSLGWGDFTLSNPNNPDGGLLQLIKDVAAIKQTKNNNSSIAPGKIDLVIGSDTFYNPPDFESLLSTVSFIINRHNTDCIFLTTYQNRSAKRNIDHLLEKWGLEGRVIERETFNFDHNKFVVNNNASDDNMDIKKSENETLMNMLEKEYESKKGTNWQSRIGKSKIESTKTLSPVEVSKNPSIALVDYSSGSDSEESEEETEVSIRIENRLIPEPIEESAEISNNDLSCSYKIGDGGSLSSVHLLLICKRGRGDITFEAWSRDHPHRSY